jgi:hypothetical protein
MPVLAARSGTARASILGISSTRRALSVVVVTARVTMDDSRVPSSPANSRKREIRSWDRSGSADSTARQETLANARSKWAAASSFLS